MIIICKKNSLLALNKVLNYYYYLPLQRETIIINPLQLISAEKSYKELIIKIFSPQHGSSLL